MPSGIFRPDVQCVVAAGVVINPPSLLQEIETLVDRGIKVGKNLMVSTRAHVIFPWHFEEDRLMNESTSGEALGTTMRGIGPCYRDKVGRSHAIRLGDMYRDNFAGRIEQIAAAKRRVLNGLGCPDDSIQLDPKEIYRQYRDYAERLRPYVGDTTAYLLDAVDAEQENALRRRAGRVARHRSWHVSLRHQQQQFGRRRVGRFRRARPLYDQGAGHRQGLLHARRRRPVSRPSRTTPSGSTFANGATNMARLRGVRGAAAGSTSWPRATRRG